MKHIFHIHSQINLLIACCIISSRRIPKKDVLFTCFRGMKGVDELGTSLSLSDEIYYHPYNSPRNLFKFKFLKNKSLIGEVDTFISKFTNSDDFIYYVPHCKNPLYQVFISNCFCKQVHYIEDGGDAYLSKDELLNKFPNKLHWSHFFSRLFLKIIPCAMSSRLKPNANLYESIGIKQSTSFALTDNSFSTGLNENVRVVNISSDVQKKFISDINYESMFLFDALVEQNVVQLEQFRTFMEWFVDSHSAIKSGISIKFHPAQKIKSKSIVFNVLKSRDIQYQEVSSETNMEIFLLSNKNKDVYGVGSSLLKYSLMKNPSQTFILFPFFTKLNDWGAVRKKVWIDLFGDLSLPQVK